MFASSLGFQCTLLLGGVLDNGLHLLKALLLTLFKTTTSRGTEFSRLLGTGGNGSILLDILLGHVADLFGPLGAVSGGGVA